MVLLAFGRPWRQTEGLPRSVATMLGLVVDIPDHTTLTRRSAALSLATALAKTDGPVTVVIDITGLVRFSLHRGGRPRMAADQRHESIVCSMAEPTSLTSLRDVHAAGITRPARRRRSRESDGWRGRRRRRR